MKGMRDILEENLISLIKKSVTELPRDVVDALEYAHSRETSKIAKVQLKTILENIKIASKSKHPICQDTGTPIFFVDVGYEFPFKKEIEPAILKAVERATENIPLRANAVDPFTGKNTGTNIGNHIPWIDWSLVKGNSCKITVFPKGGGSENGSALKMFNPTVDLDEIKRFIVEHVIEMGGKVCPPTVVGIGIGGGSDIALKLAKKSLLRPIGDRNKNKTIAKLEIDLLEEINDTGIGPMGLGGDTTALDVHIEVAHRHPASFPVGIAMQCWANRRATIIISRDGDVEWI